MLYGENLKKVYGTIKAVYRDKVGTSFSFQSGEKGRVKDIFSHVKEALKDELEEVTFEQVLYFYIDYVKHETEQWLKWDKSRRENYIGFLCRRDDIYTFVKGEIVSEDNNEIAGTQSKEQWESF